MSTRLYGALWGALLWVGFGAGWAWSAEGELPEDVWLSISFDNIQHSARLLDSQLEQAGAGVGRFQPLIDEYAMSWGASSREASRSFNEFHFLYFDDGRLATIGLMNDSAARAAKRLQRANAQLFETTLVQFSERAMLASLGDSAEAVRRWTPSTLSRGVDLRARADTLRRRLSLQDLPSTAGMAMEFDAMLGASEWARLQMRSDPEGFTRIRLTPRAPESGWPYPFLNAPPADTESPELRALEDGTLLYWALPPANGSPFEGPLLVRWEPSEIDPLNIAVTAKLAEPAANDPARVERWLTDWWASERTVEWVANLDCAASMTFADWRAAPAIEGARLGQLGVALSPEAVAAAENRADNANLPISAAAAALDGTTVTFVIRDGWLFAAGEATELAAIIEAVKLKAEPLVGGFDMTDASPALRERLSRPIAWRLDAAPLADALRFIATGLDMALVYDQRDTQAKITGRWLNMPASEALDELARQYDIRLRVCPGDVLRPVTTMVERQLALNPPARVENLRERMSAVATLAERMRLALDPNADEPNKSLKLTDLIQRLEDVSELRITLEQNRPLYMYRALARSDSKIDDLVAAALADSEWGAEFQAETQHLTILKAAFEPRFPGTKSAEFGPWVEGRIVDAQIEIEDSAVPFLQWALERTMSENIRRMHVRNLQMISQQFSREGQRLRLFLDRDAEGVLTLQVETPQKFEYLVGRLRVAFNHLIETDSGGGRVGPNVWLGFQ